MIVTLTMMVVIKTINTSHGNSIIDDDKKENAANMHLKAFDVIQTCIHNVV